MEFLQLVVSVSLNVLRGSGGKIGGKWDRVSVCCFFSKVLLSKGKLKDT